MVQIPGGVELVFLLLLLVAFLTGAWIFADSDGE